jgi:hypothetical protein
LCKFNRRLTKIKIDFADCLDFEQLIIKNLFNELTTSAKSLKSFESAVKKRGLPNLATP